MGRRSEYFSLLNRVYGRGRLNNKDLLCRGTTKVALVVVAGLLCCFRREFMGRCRMRGHLGRNTDASSLLAALGTAQEPSPRYLLNTSWSLDPMLGLIRTDLFLRNDVCVYVMPPKPDHDPLEGNLVDYLMLGLMEHPRKVPVLLVDDKNYADVLLSITAWTDESATLGQGDAMRNNPDWSRVVIIDEMDHFDSTSHGIYEDGRYLAYFKRSFANKNHSEPKGIDRQSGQRDLSYAYWPKQHNFFGFVYGITDRYLRSMWDEMTLMAWDDGRERSIPVLCTLRHNTLTDMGGRGNVIAWLDEMDISGAKVSEADSGGRADGGNAYWKAMKEAQIIVHANPGNWEGDFRLWEALCSKALVFVDYMYTSHPHALIDEQDVVYFDPLDKQGFVDKLRYYLDHKNEARRVAMNGFYKALRYHRYINRVDYMLGTVDLLTDPAYQSSGMRLKESMMRSKSHSFARQATTPSEYTLAHTAKEMASQPSPTVTDALRTRVAAKTTQWQDWIMRKKGLNV